MMERLHYWLEESETGKIVRLAAPFFALVATIFSCVSISLFTLVHWEELSPVLSPLAAVIGFIALALIMANVIVTLIEWFWKQVLLPLAKVLLVLVQLLAVAGFILLSIVATSSQSKKGPYYMLIELPQEYLRDTMQLAAKFDNWPQGRIELANIPFNLDDRGSFIQTQFEDSSDPDGRNLPWQVSIPMNVDSPKQVYILMNLSYGCTLWAPLGSKTGEISFVFAEGDMITFELQTGYNIREWVIEADKDPGYCPIVKEISAPNIIKRVWSGELKASKGVEPKVAVMDMFVFDVPPDRVGQKLTSIIIKDTSTSTTGFINPAIVVFGVSVFSE